MVHKCFCTLVLDSTYPSKWAGKRLTGSFFSREYSYHLKKKKVAMKFPCGLILCSDYGCKFFANTAIVVGSILETMLSLCIKDHQGLACQNWWAVTMTLLMVSEFLEKGVIFFFLYILSEDKENHYLYRYTPVFVRVLFHS